MTYKMEVPAMTAVIYARYSSDNQREESIEGQIRECTAYAEKNGITIVKHYIDRAISAKTDNRPEFQQMIKEMTEVYPLRGMYLGHFYFSVVSAGITPYSSALTGSA